MMSRRREDCRRDPRRAQLVVRARDHQGVWGSWQVLECWDCGRRWTA